MVFQDYALFPHLSVARNVAFGLPRHVPNRDARVASALATVGLAGLGERTPDQLSGGQQQRVALARALAPEPEVILLDEPFSNLDADLRASVREEVRQILREAGMTAVLVTHDQEEAMEVASRIVVMNHGKIEQVGTPSQLYEQPATEFVMGFVGKVNRLGDAYIRPHEVVIASTGQHGQIDGEPAEIERLLALGFETRVELRLGDGQRVWAQLAKPEAARLDLRPGQRVGVDLSQGRRIGWQPVGKLPAPPAPFPAIQRERVTVPPITRDA